MTSRASKDFWESYDALPGNIQQLAKRRYRLWLKDPWHSSFRFKPVGKYWSVRVSRDYRALGVRLDATTIVWFWIGSHSDYDAMIG
jgi:hypothetical protein